MFTNLKIPITSLLLLTACAGQNRAENPPAPVRISPPETGTTTNQPAVAFTFATALAEMSAHTPQLQAKQADIDAKTLQSEAVQGLNQPWVFLDAAAGRYHVTADIDTGVIQDRINQVGGRIDSMLGIPPAMTGVFGALSRKVSSAVANPYTVSQEKNKSGIAVSAVWPVYTGGKTQALQHFVASRAAEAKSDYSGTRNQLYSTLVERYFGTQLAQMALAIRQTAFNTINKHLHMAERFYQEGLINKVDLLKAKAALADAQSSLAQAQNTLRLAQAGLTELTGEQRPPASALFINITDLKPTDYYQQQALQHFPGFGKIAAKETQVNAVKTFAESAFLPNVALFGRHGLTGRHHDWFVGLNVHYTLWSGVDRGKMVQAADKQQEQLTAVRAQAENDIKLLVQKNRLTVSDAIHRFERFDQQLATAKEQSRLAARSFQEGLATALDAIDAQTYLAKIRTERAQAAYDYILALAKLLESAGLSETFMQYQSNAPIFIHEVRP